MTNKKLNLHSKPNKIKQTLDFIRLLGYYKNISKPNKIKYIIPKER